MKERINKFCPEILDSIDTGVIVIDTNLRIVWFNRGAEKITGFSKKEVIGKHCYETLRTDLCTDLCPLKESFKKGKRVEGRKVEILNRYGESIPVIVSTALLKENGKIIGGIETFKDITTIENLKKEVTKSYQFGDIISKNRKILELFDILPNIADSNANVLIEGPSGSGKEVFARTIHNISKRKDKPFIAVNCAALPDTLLESELFGYEKGAFTDAKNKKAGRFELANGGTLFLDEIADTSPALQAKILRAIQEKEIEPLGSTKTVKVDVRIISATNRNLLNLVQEGRFREDLYYRLNVVKITLPPLKDRKEDIPLLIHSFINKFNALMGKNIKGITEEALTVLMNHDYPGNIRELENIIEHAFVISREEYIDVKHLPEYLKEPTPRKSFKIKPLSEIEKDAIVMALKLYNGNKKMAAKALGIDRSTLWRKIKQYNIKV